MEGSSSYNASYIRNSAIGRAMIAKSMFLTKGVGRSSERLTSFELALRDAGIAPFNLVRVSSIFPPECKLVSRITGLVSLSKEGAGQIVHGVIAEQSTMERNRLISASIGLAIPDSKELYGYLAEHHGYGMTEHDARDYAEGLAIDMLRTCHGDEPLGSVSTKNITQSAIGGSEGWTTVIACAVMLEG